ncbi:MAG: ATP-binding protein [Ramlibacter sp.]
MSTAPPRAVEGAAAVGSTSITLRVVRPVWWLIGCALLLCAGAAQSATTVRVGLYRNPPKVLAPSEGGPGGIFVDVLESVAKAEGLTLAYDEGTFDSQMQRVLAGEIDLMVDVAMTEQRRELFDLSMPVLQSWNSVYAREASRIRRIGDLAGKRVAVLAGAVQEQNLREAQARLGLRTQVLRFDTYEAAFEAVRRGQADAVVSNPFYGGPTHGGLRDTSILFGDSTFHFVVKKGANTELLQAIDRHLAEMKSDPQSVYFRSFQRLQASQRGETLPPWVSWAALSLTSFLLLALAWAFAYRRVAARLRDAERGQRRLANDLRRIFDNSLDVVLVLDEQLRIVRASPACRAWGYEPRDLEGGSCLGLVASEHQARARRHLQRVLRGHRVKSLPGESLRRDGRGVPTTWSAVWAPEQREMYLVVRDDSERAELLATLRRQNDRLEAANNDLQVISASLSHDLRSPVAAIEGFTGRALELSAQRQDASEIARLLQRAVAAAAKADRMLEDLAGLLRVAGQRVHVEDCDVSAMAAQIVREARDAHPAYARTDVRIADGLRARADARLLRLALENLLGNALKFSAVVERPLVEVGVAEAPGTGETVFFVRDNGSGFDPAYADKLFQPFSRLHSQTEFPGTGLGLSIAHRIVRKHHGRIWAESAVGQGAAFYFVVAA